MAKENPSGLLYRFNQKSSFLLVILTTLKSAPEIWGTIYYKKKSDGANPEVVQMYLEDKIQANS